METSRRGAGQTGASVRTFYRIVRTNPPTLRDFTSNAVLGRPAPDPSPAGLRLWAGLSVQATETQARNRARDLPRLGVYIARIQIPPDAPILWERTLGRGHYTLWGAPAEIARRVVAVVPVEPVG